MQIPSRAWGFVRSRLNGRFGVRVADFGTGGTVDNPLLNDVDAGDEAAGVEFCPVFAAQEASGTLTVRSDGSLSFVGEADGVAAFLAGDVVSSAHEHRLPELGGLLDLGLNFFRFAGHGLFLDLLQGKCHCGSLDGGRSNVSSQSVHA